MVFDYGRKLSCLFASEETFLRGFELKLVDLFCFVVEKTVAVSMPGDEAHEEGRHGFNKTLGRVFRIRVLHFCWDCKV